jgi:hypothetical protein
MDDRWAGTGTFGDAYAVADHPYAADLDLFGKGSLFELLCTARTGAGEETLAAWLGAGAPPAVVRARQGAVEELRERLDLREDLALLGEDARADARQEPLTRWGTAPPRLPFRWLRVALFALVAATLAALAAWAWLDLSPLVSALLVLAEMAVARVILRPVQAVTGAVTGPEQRLETLGLVLARFERERFESPALVWLQQALLVDSHPAAARIRSLTRLVEWLQASRNQLFAPIALVTLWDAQFACALEAWRARCGPRLGPWIAALGELEALVSLSTYAFEHPQDPFPELLDGPPRLEGDGLGHPLRPDDGFVRNEVRLGAEPALLLLSGSNMSGKSTYLRTVGVNTVLALAGAPVRARRLALTPFSIGATLRIQDSLQAGTSRFYAEITRLRQLVDLAAGPPPLLFLLDEILAGTNSHDRRQGAEAILRGLLEKGAVGVCTTHDLALAEAAEALGAKARNAHFEDALVDGKLVFDYTLRPGVVKKSNALELMRAVGLSV